MTGEWGCTECRRFPLRACNQRPPRLVQTRGGCSVTPLSTELVFLGRLLFFGVARSPVTFLVTTLRWPPVRCAAGLVFLLGAVPRDQTPGPRPVTLSSEGRPLLAVSGSSWVPARSVVASSLDGVWSLAITVHRGPEPVRASVPPVPGPRGGRGHTCRTPPRACSVSNATSPSIECQGMCLAGRRAATTP